MSTCFLAVEDVLIQVDKFYYPIDFMVLDTEPVAVGLTICPSSWGDHSWLLIMR